jgi:NAD(P)-dependent dehydrogenase (short-subunit alcohol dehydrogenase family)
MMAGNAWVVGGTGGIGGACAQGLAADGFTVHTSDRPDEDITQPGVAATVAGRLAAGGPLVAAVHTIGMSGRRLGDGPPSICSDEAWDEILRVDLTSAFYFVRACLQHSSPGASVVLIGSALAKGLDGDFLTVAYRVAKAAMIPLIEAAAYEGARKGIRFNIVAPGLVDTPMAARALGTDEIIARFPEIMPLTKRPSTAGELAAAVRWLVSEQAPQTTGAVIPVDGGWLLR